MKIAFIGDIHGYLPALESALEICHDENIDVIVGLGDYIDGFDANDACVELARSHFDHAVSGNHDELHAGDLAPGNRDWLCGLPTELTLNGWLVTHSSPRADRQGEYVNSSIMAWNCFDDFDFQRCVVGHAHYGQLYQFNSKKSVDCDEIELTAAGIKLMPDQRYLLANPSLAYNRDFDRRPAFCILDNATSCLRVIVLEMPPLFEH